jgi:hypothetical protein
MSWDSFDDELWDEYQWESHINEIEQKSDRLKEIINATLGENGPGWTRFMKEFSSEQEALDAYIEEELLFEEAYYPDDDEFDSEDDEEWDDLFFNSDEDPFLEDDDEEEGDSDVFNEEESDDAEDFLDGEEWKAESDDYIMSDYGSLENLKIYSESREIGIGLLHISRNHGETLKNRYYLEFVSGTLDICIKLAAGYGFGFERDVLGANIAYAKKALTSANRALAMLQHLKKKASVFTKEEYLKLHERIFELRNDIGIYVQELRDQFRSSI